MFRLKTLFILVDVTCRAKPTLLYYANIELFFLPQEFALPQNFSLRFFNEDALGSSDPIMRGNLQKCERPYQNIRKIQLRNLQ